MLALAIPDVLIRWWIYIEECSLRELRRQTQDFSIPELKSKDRIDIGSFLNLAGLTWGEFSHPSSRFYKVRH